MSDQLNGDPQSDSSVADAYWKANVRLLAVLMIVWTIAGVLIPFVFVGAVNAVPFFGFKLGFWVAQQGAIYVFVALIFIYAWRVQKIEHALGLED